MIAEISPQANRAKATVQVKVQILNPDELSTAGDERNCEVPGRRKEEREFEPSGVFVPTTAVRDDDGKKFVFIAFNGKALKREVQVVSQRSGGLIVKGLMAAKTLSLRVHQI